MFNPFFMFFVIVLLGAREGVKRSMRLFNSFQIVALFAAAPWLLGLLYQQAFPWHTAASVAATVLYGVYALGMTCLVYLGSRELQ